MPAEFLDMPPVEKSGSMHGYYIIPSVGSYYAGIKMSGEGSILEGLKPLNNETPGFIERAKEDQYLRLWDEEDLQRLGLKSLQIQDGYTKRHSIMEVEYEERQEVDPLDLIRRS